MISCATIFPTSNFFNFKFFQLQISSTSNFNCKLQLQTPTSIFNFRLKLQTSILNFPYYNYNLQLQALTSNSNFKPQLELSLAQLSPHLFFNPSQLTLIVLRVRNLGIIIIIITSNHNRCSSSLNVVMSWIVFKSCSHLTKFLFLSIRSFMCSPCCSSISSF